MPIKKVFLVLLLIMINIKTEYKADVIVEYQHIKMLMDSYV